MEASTVGGFQLLGFWASPFSLKVEVALKLKGIPYEYQEEDLQKKSDSLLRFNPIYKTVPVLAHDGRPIAESLIILEYLDDILADPPLLPADPYSRSRIRFWVDFFYTKFVPPCRSIIFNDGEEQEKAVKESRDQLIQLEKGVAEEFTSQALFFHGDSPGLLDIVVGSTSGWIRVLEELTGSEILSMEATPVLCRRIEAFVGLQIVKETMPEHERLRAYAQKLMRMGNVIQDPKKIP